MEYKIGDKVLVDGTVGETSTIEIYIEFSNGHHGWIAKENIHPVDVPDKPKMEFSIGDKVIYLNAPELGVCKIKDIDADSMLTHYIKSWNGYRLWTSEDLLVLAYPNKAK